MQNWQSPYPIAFFFYILQGYNKIRFIIEVGPFKDGIKRSKFLEYLKNKGIEIKDSSMAVEARYTRIFSKSINYTDWEDTEKLSKDILDLFNKEECQDKFKEVSKIVEEYNFNQ